MEYARYLRTLKIFFVVNLEGSPAKIFVEALPNFGRAPDKKILFLVPDERGKNSAGEASR